MDYIYLLYLSTTLKSKNTSNFFYLTIQDAFINTIFDNFSYTYVGDNFKYPEIRSIRYPKTSTINPNVTVYVVNLSVPKYVFPQQIKLPIKVENGSYVGGMVWLTPVDLSVTFTNREQTSALTVLCPAPNFNCREV